MSVLEPGCYRNNRLLMSVVGAWPYQSKASCVLAYLLYFFVAGSQFYFKIAYVRYVWPDPIVLSDCTTPIIVEFISIVKFFNLLINTRKIKGMLDEVITGNEWPPNSDEAAIMEGYNRNVQRTTVIWISCVYSTVVTWNVMPMLPLILGAAENQTKQLPIPVYYHTDIDDYFYLVLAHGVVAGYTFITGLIAADTLYVLLAQHACAMFSILGYKLQNAVTEKDESHDMHPEMCDDMTYKNLTDCVKHHTKAIEFADMVESAHKFSFLLTVILNMLIISITGVQMVNNLEEIHILFRQSAMIASLMCQLFLDNYYAQLLTDHSLETYMHILRIKWYRASLRSKKLLIFFIARTLKPSVLTIGGLFVMSMENFSSVLQTSASYITILLSMQ